MTMPASPNTLNMAGTSSPVSVAYELGLGLTTTISMNDAAVRTLAGVGGSGTTWSMNSLYGKSNLTISNTLDCHGLTDEFGASTARINFNPGNGGGITYFDPSISYGSTAWASAAGYGSDYWIKITRVSGITPSGMTSGTLYQLSTQPSMYITTVFSGQTRVSSGNIDIYSDAAGTTRVGGGVYYLRAYWEP